MGKEAHKDLFDRWLKAFNSQNARGIMALFTEDGALEDLPQKTRLPVGKELEEFLDFNFKAFPNWRFDVDRWDATADTMTIEWTMRCAKMGPIPGVSSEGKPLELRGVTVLETRDGRIKAERDYWDMADALRQTGDLPSH